MIACKFEKLAYNRFNIKKRADALTNLPPGKVDRGSGCGSIQSNQPEDALKLYEQLAEQGFYVGLKMAGFCRHVGIGCSPDRLMALRWYFEIAKGFGMNRFASEMVDCLRNTDHQTKLEQDAIVWIRDAARVSPAGQNMLRSLGDGPTDDPVAHDAGYGYLGTDPLVRVSEK